MHSFARKSLFLCLALLVSHTSFAKKRPSFRALLNKIHITASIGYGGTQYSHQVYHDGLRGPRGETVVFKEGDQFYLYAGDPGSVYLVRWFDGPYIHTRSYTDWDLAELKRAETSMKFEGQGATIPISLGAHVDLWRRMRIGFGGTFFINRIEKLEPEEAHADLGPYIPSQKTHYYLRPFVSLGYKFIENSTFSVLLDTNFGLDYLYSFVDPKFIDAFNLGVKSIGITLESNISEYLRLFGRLSYEQSDYMRSLGQKKLALVLERKSILFQLSFSINYPEIPRCSLDGCKIERKHRHGGQAYRGVSIFTHRDAQERKIYKNNPRK